MAGIAKIARKSASVFCAPLAALAILCAAMVFVVVAAPSPAFAQCCICGCECEDSASNQPKTRETVVTEHRQTRMFFGTAASFGADSPSPYGEPHTGELDPPNTEFPVDNDLNHGGVGGGRQIPHYKWDNPWPDHPTYAPGETLTLNNAVPRPPRGELDDALGKKSGTGQLGLHQNWIIEELFFYHILPAMMRMQQEFTGVMMQQAFVVGKFFDAKIQMDTVQTLQRMEAETRKDYQPNLGMCVFGTNVRSLGESDFKADLTTTILSRRDIQRNLSNAEGVGANGTETDLFSRIDHFKKTYCDKYDNNNLKEKPSETGLAPLCERSVTKRMADMDVDYMRTVLTPRTLNVNFHNPTLTHDEEAVMSLSNNIYGHTLFSVIPPAILKPKVNHDDYLDLRSVVAKRSVAQNSFDSLVALKTESKPQSEAGSEGSGEDTYRYMKVLLTELGMKPDEIKAWLGSPCTDTTFCPQPSYMAQMEMLTKKIYQRPEFYTELYDTPANTKRRGVAMQAIGVMLDRDLYKSYLRSEAIMSTLLELRLIKEQDRIQNNVALSSPTGP